MLSAEKRIEVSRLIGDLGIDAAAKKLGLSRETVRRYSRLSREGDSRPVDELPQAAMLQKIGERCSDKELKAIFDSVIKPVDVHKSSEVFFTGEWFRVGVMSDVHGGSQYLDDWRLVAAIEECNRSKCDQLWIAGDLTEGMSGRDGHIYELTYAGYRAQREYVVSRLKAFNGPIKAISGNHDLWYMSKSNSGALIVEDVCRDLGDQAEYLGEHEGTVLLNGARVTIWHGEDGAAYALSYRIQKIIESLDEDSLPGLIIAGHDHKALMLPDVRGVVGIGAGCIQSQTPFMRSKKLRAYLGFWILDVCVRDGRIVRIKPEWIPLKIKPER